MSIQQVVDWLFGLSFGAPSLWYLVIAAYFSLTFGGSLIVYLLRRSLFPGHSLNIQLARRFSTYGMILGGIGLLLVGARYLGLGFLQMRFLLLLAILGTLALAAYLVWFRRTRYPELHRTYLLAKARDRFVQPRNHSARRRERKARR